MDIFLKNIIRSVKSMLKDKRGEERISDKVFSGIRGSILELITSMRLKTAGFGIKKERGKRYIISEGYDIGYLTMEDKLPTAVLRQSLRSGIRPSRYKAEKILSDFGYVLRHEGISKVY